MKLTAEQAQRLPIAQAYAQRIVNRGKRAYAEAYLNYIETMLDFADDTAVAGLTMHEPSGDEYDITLTAAHNVRVRIQHILTGEEDK